MIGDGVEVDAIDEPPQLLGLRGTEPLRVELPAQSQVGKAAAAHEFDAQRCAHTAWGTPTSSQPSCTALTSVLPLP